jgi:hypothetical protein
MIKYRNELHRILPDNSDIAEIGCAEGYFSADILRWPNCKSLLMVDNWGKIENQTGDGNNPQGWHDKNYSDAMMRVNFAIEKVKILRGISWDMAKRVEDESLDLLYIDCCHTYECVTKDLRAWYPKVKLGGVVAGHDFLNKAYGVRQAVIDFGKGFTVIPENKDEDAGFYFIKKD